MTSLDTDLSEDLLRVLADPLRLRIVRLLAAEALCVCHLVEMTNARQTNVSNHLRVLRQAGLVETEPFGRYTYYRLRPELMDRLARHLGDLADIARTTVDRDRRRPCP
jgi:ArsR family transcriptional regulator